MAEYINPDYVAEPEKMNVKKGLEGVVMDTSSVSKVNAETNSLVYRGYPVQDLAENCSFEEVAYLLYTGELPNKTQLETFTQKERSLRDISKENLNVIKALPKKCHPMDSIRTGVSFLGCEDERIWDASPDTNLDKAIRLLAKIPTMIAADFRFKKGLDFIAPNPALSMAENFFHMCFGKVPDAKVVKAFDVSLILYAEHSFNASTFTARVVTSTQSDIYSATTAGIGALKGPLHGGANEMVMHMMLEIADPAKAEQWMIDALAQKKKVMGFGHRVYKSGDSRVPTMKKYAQVMADVTGEQKWMQMYSSLEKVMVEKKKIYPNLDFPAGPAYYMMGFEIDFFTPIFVMARTTGWSAHIMEQAANNRIIRPLSEYIGSAQRKVTPLNERG
ncbi:bifunctional 2-methylcitrate synthase/citrate synthase [Pseudobdellovibrio exovorus]|uniref:Citrate synthase n=1 Tax=Pseudobdellovibrio exovorus JSS TaxID=1184267 RepID=M4VPV9_9BACT|nr:bifunctional 2-methylcitrate synthase/citrate synthase [Pseudobdellovibrio exovorus]AGH95174.1 methylcitrate synthase [Pseudobdellovibrio exovorus JSS]